VADSSNVGLNGGKDKLVRRNMMEHEPEALLDWLTREKPHFLVTSPSMVARLAELTRRDSVPLSIEQVITFGEVVTPETRVMCKDVFGAKITDRYSCEELGWIALQCPINDHYHVSAATAMIEIVDDFGRACAVGEAGRVLVTGLHSYAMPLIRYEIGDYAEWGEPCDCGITLPVIRQIWGRKRNFVHLPHGGVRLARLAGEHWRGIAPIREYRLVQYLDYSIDAFVRCDEPLTRDQEERITGMIQRVLGYPFDILVRRSQKIDWGPNWKREEFVHVERHREASRPPG
jgi:phenylacetate-CoA ligase